uniref:Uncharacterized protein n=1 Tax=Vitis vinifera TaxID=29760 RepID=A5AK82_VITVI|nr:hypothetical protein VITISV_021321 [Vitis vinifera]
MEELRVKPLSASSTSKRTLMPALNTRLWYTPHLELPDGIVLKGATLVAIRPSEQSATKKEMLAQHPKWQGRTVLVKIANPARKSDRDLKVIQVEATVEAMNKATFHGAFRTHSLIPAYISFHPGSTSA